MIKLQDFARQMGVTDRAVQKQLKKYETELAGMFERRGKNGTWLSDEAAGFLRRRMKTQAVEIYDPVKDVEIERLKERIAYLEKYATGKEQYIATMEIASQAKQMRIEELEKNQLLLEEKSEEERRAAEEKLQEVQNRVDQLEAEISRPLSFIERITGKRKM